MAENLPNTEDIDVRALARALATPFDESEVRFKPQAAKGNGALAVAYVDVRSIMDRLDNALGFENWQDDYQLLPDNSVMCRLRLRIGTRWITKMDVGGPSEQPDGGDRLKAAVSDALKRAAVKFGIGRYLYRLPQQWADYDPVKKQFPAPPRLPDLARSPRGGLNPRPNSSSSALRGGGRGEGSAGAAPSRPLPPGPPLRSGEGGENLRESRGNRETSMKKVGLPENGPELHRRLRDADSELASKGLCPVGALLTHVTQAGVKAGFGADLNQWDGPAIELAVAETRAFKSRLASSPETKTAA